MNREEIDDLTASVTRPEALTLAAEVIRLREENARLRREKGELERVIVGAAGEDEEECWIDFGGEG
jgi:hypothetical protein